MGNGMKTGKRAEGGLKRLSVVRSMDRGYLLFGVHLVDGEGL